MFLFAFCVQGLLWRAEGCVFVFAVVFVWFISVSEGWGGGGCIFFFFVVVAGGGLFLLAVGTAGCQQQNQTKPRTLQQKGLSPPQQQNTNNSKKKQQGFRAQAQTITCFFFLLVVFVWCALTLVVLAVSKFFNLLHVWVLHCFIMRRAWALLPVTSSTQPCAEA